MTIHLRAHHLLCTLTFKGEGYSPAFVANYISIVNRLNQGEDVLIVEGPDDICAPLLQTSQPHCLASSVLARDATAARVLSSALGRPIDVGSRIDMSATHTALSRQAFHGPDVRQACNGCEWSALCTGIAAADYANVLLHPAAPMSGEESTSSNAS